MSEARGGDPPTTKLKHKFKANHSSNVDAPREDSVPLPPFGWKTVNRKTRENDQDRNKTGKLEKKRFPLRLVERDWSIKVLPFLGNQQLDAGAHHSQQAEQTIQRSLNAVVLL